MQNAPTMAWLTVGKSVAGKVCCLRRATSAIKLVSNSKVVGGHRHTRLFHVTLGRIGPGFVHDAVVPYHFQTEHRLTPFGARGPEADGHLGGGPVRPVSGDRFAALRLHKIGSISA